MVLSVSEVRFDDPARVIVFLSFVVRETMRKKIELDFGAITIDNSILKGEGYKFHEGLLAQLKQFNNSPVKVIQTDIIHNEAKKHISIEISKARSSIEQALRSASKQLKINSDEINAAKSILSADGSDEEIAEERLQNYYTSVGAILLDSAEYADLPTLMDLYFCTNAPFESGKDKKNEFPDAIALLCIEGWAEKNDIKVIAVSDDKGWHNFAEESSPYITVFSTLSEALQKLQPHAAVMKIISQIREDSLFDEENHVLDRIENEIKFKVESSDVTVEAYSSMYYNEEDATARYISHILDNDEQGMISVIVVRIDDDSIVLKAGATVKVEFEITFDFHFRDSIDGDFVYMGKNIIKQKDEFHTDILITLGGDFSHSFKDININEIEITDIVTAVDLGYIGPV